MTRKDYVLIAEAIKDTREEYALTDSAVNTLSALVAVISSRLENENPRFDVERFEKACGF